MLQGCLADVYWRPWGNMDQVGLILLYALIAVLGVVAYLLPAFIAAKRNCKAGNGIAIVNIFLGWTLIGWVVALAWAASGEIKLQTARTANA